MVGMLYPAPIRSLGAGWAQAAGRVGAFAAQVAGGFLLSQHTPVKDIFVVPAIVVGIAAIATLGVVIQARQLFGTLQLREVTSDEKCASQVSR